MAKSPFTYLQLKESDLNTIDELHALFPRWKRKSLIKKLKETFNGKDLRFVAQKKGRIVAHLMYRQGEDKHSHRAEMSSLIVLKNERGKGVASALIKYSLKRLPKKVSLVLLAVDKKNRPALSLYKKLGFKKYGYLEKASFIEGKYVNNYLLKKEI